MTVYGVGRNSAISSLTGPVRALSEFGGEFTFRSLVHDLGGDPAGAAQKLAVLYRCGRYDADFRRSTTFMEKRQALIKEIADIAISWPCLVAQAFGLNYVRCLQRALQQWADQLGITITFPD